MEKKPSPAAKKAKKSKDTLASVYGYALFGSVLSPTAKNPIEAVKRLIKLGANLSLKDKSGQTALHGAAKMGKDKVLALLLEAGMNPNALDDLGHSPLLSAAYDGKAKCVEILLKAGAKQDARRAGNFFTPLYAAATAGHADCVKLLMSDKEARSRRGENGESPLHTAASSGHLECVELLKSAGCCAWRNNEGQTPLMVAAAFGRIDCVKALLPLSDPMVKARNKMRAVEYAAHGGHPLVVEALSKTKKKPLERLRILMEAMQWATLSEAGRKKAMPWLLKNGPRGLALRDKLGRAPVHWAALSGARWWFETGFTEKEAKARDKGGETPLDLARKHSSANAAKIIERAMKVWREEKAISEALAPLEPRDASGKMSPRL